MIIEEFAPMLRQNPWLKQLPEDVTSELLTMCKLKTLQRGQRLHAKNDPAEGLYCVLQGRVRISNVSTQGREMVLTWLEPGSWFGEISLFDGLPRTHDAHGETDCQLIVLPAAQFHLLLEHRPELYPHFMRLLCQRIRATFSLIDETGSLSLKGQLAKRLMLLASGLGQHTELQLDIHISQESLAHMINSSRQTVNKLLSELQTSGAVDLLYGEIRIKDPDQLIALSQT